MSAGGRKADAQREVSTTSLHPEGVGQKKRNSILQVPFALDRLQQGRKSCITTAAHGGQHEIPHWQRLLTSEYIKKLRPLPVFEKYKISNDTLLNFADCLAKVLNNECIPEALRAWPREKRDARWLFLNPYTTVIKVNPAKPLGDFVHGILNNRSRHHVIWYSCCEFRVHEAPPKNMGLAAHK